MSVLERIHEGYVFGRRVRTLADHLAGLLPPGAAVLDVGCGDGLLDLRILQQRPDVTLRGIDVLVRGQTHIPVEPFDGQSIPYADGSFDVVMFVDVLHHTDDPLVLLREAVRVARKAVVLKDHTANGFLASPTLRFMDRVGNARHGVVLPFNYWPRQRWLDAFRALGLTVAAWKTDLGLYPWPASWVFGRSLHFVARLEMAEVPVYA
jgi:SAM-dependent methyltransferase